MSFTNFSGGLVNTVVAGLGNNISTGLTNQLTSNIQFSVGNVLAGAVEDVSGYALNAGENYLYNQVASLVPPSVGNGLANAVATQVASVGINALKGFASQTVGNLLGQQNPISGTLGSAGIGGQGGFIGLHAEGLPDAEYNDARYSITPDVVFSVVPANAGAQTQPQPQTAPKFSLNDAFSAKFSPVNNALGSFKGGLATEGAAKGLSLGRAGSFAETGKLGSVTPASATGSTTKPTTTNFFSIPVGW